MSVSNRLEHIIEAINAVVDETHSACDASSELTRDLPAAAELIMLTGEMSSARAVLNDAIEGIEKSLINDLID